MSQKEQFQVKPIARYEQARYFAAPATENADAIVDDRPHPAAVALTLLLVLGISVGLIGCYMRTEYGPGEPPEPQPDADPPDPPDCDEGSLRCGDATTLESCTDGEWVAEDCQALCVEELGADHHSLGCDASAEDPCQCQYDIIDGDYDPCWPNDLFCQDASTVVFCDEDWAPTSCAEHCAEQYGPGFTSLGCDQNVAENPCQCTEDILDGIAASCTPGDVTCADSSTLVTCVDGVEQSTSCNEHCVATMGPDYYSEGCDAARADNPCGCVYGMVDGGMIDCEPGDVWCADEATLAVCTDHDYTYRACADVCVETLGEGATSAGCDAEREADPCGCVAPDAGSGGEE
jgi:hypothetical protein